MLVDEGTVLKGAFKSRNQDVFTAAKRGGKVDRRMSLPIRRLIGEPCIVVFYFAGLGVAVFSDVDSQLSIVGDNMIYPAFLPATWADKFDLYFDKRLERFDAIAKGIGRGDGQFLIDTLRAGTVHLVVPCAPSSLRAGVFNRQGWLNSSRDLRLIKPYCVQHLFTEALRMNDPHPGR